jgi:geranylgeranyl pyrophosphate synthase
MLKLPALGDILEHSQLIKLLSHNLELQLKTHLPNNEFSDISTYGVLPPGKLFRPLLAAYTYAHYMGNQRLNSEISNPRSAISYFCSGLEIHHAYTLMHDDLPCMDNDDMRRGKASAHVKYGEWRALLAADGLINTSYSLWSKMDHSKMQTILQLSSWCLGPRGLILGQAFDLSEQMKESFDKLIWTHQLKTGRLIQLSILGAALLSDQNQYSEYKILRRFSEALGLAFQLIDDLTELCDEKLSEHEKEVNPWPKNFKQTYERTLRELSKVENNTDLLTSLKLSRYFGQMEQKLSDNEDFVLNHLQKNATQLRPLMSVLKRLSHF